MRQSHLSTALREIIARLEFQNATGKLLEGWKVTTRPTTDTDSSDELAGGAVRVHGVLLAEKMVPRTHGCAQVTMAIEVAVKRELGYEVLLDACALVLDALEMPTDSSVVDLQLNQTTINGTDTKAENVGQSELALSTLLAIRVETVPYNRGGRGKP